jgi:DNA-binding beta-propeller fold protein YncE
MTVTASIRVPGLDDQDGIAIGRDVWVTNGSHHQVVAIDPLTTQVVRRIKVPHIPVQVVADGQNAWVISATNGVGRIYGIDGATGVVTPRGQLATSPRLPFTAGEGSAWVAEGVGLRRFGSDGSTAIVDVSGGAVSALTFGDGSVWVLLSGGGILRIDPYSGHTIASFPSPAGIGLAEAAGKVWILTDTGSRSKTVYIPDPRDPSLVVSFDADTGQPVGRAVKVGFAPAWIAADGREAWVAKFDPARLLRISTA